MTEVAGGDVAQLVRGALDFERTEAGVIPVRLPTRLARQIPDGITNEIFRAASGVRLEFETEATAVEVDVACYRGAVVGGLDLPQYPCMFDLVVDGSRVAEHTVEDPGTRTFDLEGDLVGEERRTTTIRFDGLPAGRKTVELWLPHTAVVEVCALRADAPARARRDGRARWLHYGSSISHCFEAHSPTRTWPAVAARLADVHLVSMGVAGACFLDQFAARAIRDEPAEFISLKVGINVVNADAMKLRTFGPAVDGFLDTVREGHPDTPLLVVSPIVCPPHEDAPGPTVPRDPDGPFVATARPVDPADAPYALTLRRMRTILEEIVRARSADDRHLHYLDGLALFGESDLDDLPDLLHPNGDGYVRMGERFAAAAFGAGGPFISAR
jgi:hypothetical protein